MRVDQIQLRVFIEGVQIGSVSSVSVTTHANEVSQASIQMPPPVNFRSESLKRARVHIFWSDKYIRATHADNEWPILFEGEISGDSMTKGVGQRALSFDCIGYHSYWEQVLLYYYNFNKAQTSEALYAVKRAMFLGNKNVSLNSNLSGIEVSDRIASVFSSSDDSYGRIVKSIFGESVNVNAFFESANERLKLDKRFGLVKDESLESLLTKEMLLGVIDSDVSGFSGRSTMMDVLKSVMSKFRYQIICNAQPTFINVDDSKYDNIALAREKSRREFNAREAFRAFLDAHTALGDGLKDELIYQLGAQDPADILATILRADSKAEATLDIIIAYDRGIKDAADVKKDGSENREPGDDVLAQYLLVPDTRFAAVPRCNVVFPQDQSMLVMSRNLLAEPTRAMTTTEAVASVPSQLFFAPKSMGSAVIPAQVYTPSNGEGYVFPVVGDTRITSGYGKRQIKAKFPVKYDPKTGAVIESIKHPSGEEMHWGVDIAGAKRGTALGREVVAVTDGTVKLAGLQDPTNVFVGYGRRVYIDHGAGQVSRYAHLATINVTVGEKVVRGQVIGTVGGDRDRAPSGSSNAAHLHFEWRVKGEAVDPQTTVLAGAEKLSAGGAQTLASGTATAAGYEQPEQSIEDQARASSTPFKDYLFLTPEEQNVGIVPMFDDDTVRSHTLFAADVSKQQSFTSYMTEIVQSEWLWARYSTRSISALTMPFNPRVVAGFPGLVVDATRSVIARVTSVTHTISVGGGSGSAASVVSFDGPRYWDEGDPYYWDGGNMAVDSQGRPAADVANFPVYYQPGLVHTNSIDGADFSSDKRIPGFNKRIADNPQPADLFYRTLLGVNAIPYDYARTGDDEYTPTGEPASYNRAIDNPGRDGGNWYPNTIVGRYYGLLEESGPERAEQYVRDFTHRPMATESEVMEYVLGAKRDRNGYAGGPFDAKIAAAAKLLRSKTTTVNASRG